MKLDLSWDECIELVYMISDKLNQLSYDREQTSDESLALSYTREMKEHVKTSNKLRSAIIEEYGMLPPGMRAVETIDGVTP